MTDSKQIIKGWGKELTASEFKTDRRTSICLINIYFLAHCFLTSKISGGAQAPPAPPPATGLLYTQRRFSFANTVEPVLSGHHRGMAK